jgi:hypothetical protein
MGPVDLDPFQRTSQRPLLLFRMQVAVAVIVVRGRVLLLVKGKHAKYSALRSIPPGRNKILPVDIDNVKTGDDQFWPIFLVLKKLKDL